MKTMRAVLVLCASAWVAVSAQDFKVQTMPKYDARYDYLDLDDLLYNDRLIKNYVQCLLYSQRCSPEGKELKKVLPDALRTKCVRCTEKQKRGAVKVIRRLKGAYPEEWAQLQARWDPTGDLTRYFENYIAKEAFNIIPDSGTSIEGTTFSGSTYLPPAPSPAVLTIPQTTKPPPPPPSPTVVTSPRPMVVNRFGDDGELMMGSPSAGAAAATLRPTAVLPAATPRPAAVAPAVVTTTTTAAPAPTRPAQTVAAASDAFPTRFPTRPAVTEMPIYTTAATIIDLISEKIKLIVRKTVEVVSGL